MFIENVYCIADIHIETFELQLIVEFYQVFIIIPIPKGRDGTGQYFHARPTGLSCNKHHNQHPCMYNSCLIK